MSPATLAHEPLEFAKRESEHCRWNAKAALIALEIAESPADRLIASEACIEGLRRYRAAIDKLAREARHHTP